MPENSFKVPRGVLYAAARGTAKIAAQRREEEDTKDLVILKRTVDVSLVKELRCSLLAWMYAKQTLGWRLAEQAESYLPEG